MGDANYDVVGFGEIAKELAGFPAGTLLGVEGPMVTHRWETGDAKRDRTEVEVETIFVRTYPQTSHCDRLRFESDE